MKKKIWILSLLLSGCAIFQVNPSPPLDVVNSVNLERYMGKWYEIASIPVSFQKDCVGTTATYSLQPNGDVSVFNQCHKHKPDGPLQSIQGHAWVPDKDVPAKLKVQFFWPFSGDYWIIQLDSEYRYAVVGHPSRDYLWILSREPQMASTLYDRILARLIEQGYDTKRLKSIQS